MKKSVIPALFFLFTLVVCSSFQPFSETFKEYEKNSFNITPYGSSGCEISVKNEKGLVKKYSSPYVNASCAIKHFDFNGDKKDEVCITDGKNFEIVDFSKDIPMRISDKENFYPINMRFTKNESSVTAHLDNGQTFELSPKDINEPMTLSDNAKISFTDHNSDNIYEICITQEIINSKNETLYSVNTYRTFNGRYFTISNIKAEEKKN